MKRKTARKTVRRKPKPRKHMRLIAILMITAVIVVSGLWYFNRSLQGGYIKRQNVLASIPKGFSSFGIDVSHHQGEIDWEELLHKQHYDTIINFVYCKVTEGEDHVDTQWIRNRKYLQKLHMPHGAYHFFIPETNAINQARHFLQQYKAESYDLPPVLDVEREAKNDKQLIDQMRLWLTEVEKQTGMRPIIYTSLHFFETKFQQQFKEYKFWIAAYSRRPKCIEDSRIIHWQFTETGKLPIIKEHVDFNVSKIALRY